jgi:hypothetical protein
MQKMRQEDLDLEFYEVEHASQISDWFRFQYGSATWAYWQMRNYMTIGFYWKFDKWGA